MEYVITKANLENYNKLFRYFHICDIHYNYDTSIACLDYLPDIVAFDIVGDGISQSSLNKEKLIEQDKILGCFCLLHKIESDPSNIKKEKYLKYVEDMIRIFDYFFSSFDDIDFTSDSDFLKTKADLERRMPEIIAKKNKELA